MLHHCHPLDNVKPMAMPGRIPGGLKREDAVTGSSAVGTASEPQLGRRLRPAFRSCCQNVGHARLSKNNGRVSRLFDESGSDGGSVTGATCDPYLAIFFEVEIALADVRQVAVGRSVDMARTPLGGGAGKDPALPDFDGVYASCSSSHIRLESLLGLCPPGSPLRGPFGLSPARLSGATAIAHNRIV